MGSKIPMYRYRCREQVRNNTELIPVGEPVEVKASHQSEAMILFKIHCDKRRGHTPQGVLVELLYNSGGGRVADWWSYGRGGALA
jgi:hypothetical protein